MTTKPLFHSACAAAVFTMICLPAGQLSAQEPIMTPPPLDERTVSEAALRTDDSFPVVISYDKGKEIQPGSDEGITNLVGLYPSQLVDLTVQFPLSWAGERVSLLAIDGGIIRSDTGEHAYVSGEATLQFQFQANTTFGLSRVLIRRGTDEYGLRFYVLDPDRPERNPRIQIAD